MAKDTDTTFFENKFRERFFVDNIISARFYIVYSNTFQIVDKSIIVNFL